MHASNARAIGGVRFKPSISKHIFCSIVGSRENVTSQATASGLVRIYPEVED
jgi:hypothetical protein